MGTHTAIVCPKCEQVIQDTFVSADESVWCPFDQEWVTLYDALPLCPECKSELHKTSDGRNVCRNEACENYQ